MSSQMDPSQNDLAKAHMSTCNDDIKAVKAPRSSFPPTSDPQCWNTDSNAALQRQAHYSPPGAYFVSGPDSGLINEDSASYQCSDVADDGVAIEAGEPQPQRNSYGDTAPGVDFLATAELVPEPTSDDVYTVVEGQAVVEQSPAERARKRHRRRFLIVLLILTTLLAVVVAVAAVLTSTRTNSDTPTDSNKPSTSPTLSAAFRELLNNLPNHTLSLLQEANSPQSQAWMWLITAEVNSNTNLQWKLRQRFSLASLSFSTSAFSLHFNAKKSSDWIDECLWDGIACDDEGGNVTWISLPGGDLKGPLPRELYFLSDLSTLNFSGNDLTGELSPDVQFTRLVSLDLSGTQLQGTLPTKLGHLSQLTALNLNNMMLTGTIPSELGKATRLEYLDLSINDFDGTLPPELGLLLHLTNLELYQMSVTGPIPVDIGRLTNLLSLDLSQSALEHNIPTQLGLLTGLVSLDLGVNSFDGSIPTQLGLLSLLTNLALYDIPLTGTIPTQLGQLASLVSLDLTGTFLTGTIPSELCQWMPANGGVLDVTVDCTLVVPACDCTCA